MGRENKIKNIHATENEALDFLDSKVLLHLLNVEILPLIGETRSMAVVVDDERNQALIDGLMSRYDHSLYNACKKWI